MNASSPPASGVFPVLPLKNSALFPEMMMPLAVGRAMSVAAVEEASNGEDKMLVIVSQKNPAVEEPTYEDLFTIGTLAVIKKMEQGPLGLQVIVQGLTRVMLEQDESGPEPPFLKARVQPMALPDDEGTEVDALHRIILEQVEKIVSMTEPQAQAGMSRVFAQLKDPLKQVYLLASLLPIDLEKEQAILAATTRAAALRLMVEYVTHEANVLELRQKIASQAQSELSREQREYLLRQQLQAIQQELGETGPEQAALGELREQLAAADLPEKVREQAEREVRRLERIPTASPEHQLTRSYVELILELPWNKLTEDNLDLDHAQQVLDEDHYDLKDIKDRIIEHLAVLKLNPQAKAPILCFVGPPGVGKTSLGQSIARSLGRVFERMSLGGLHDEAELRGHRRTYIGAMPGRIIQGIRRAGVRNPLIMLDEIDKIGRDFRGDPASALMEILDPAQNFEFHDNYLDLPFDLSRVFFITTANTLDTIPQPLLDRMELLRLAGYTHDEKMNIARQYLIGRQLTQTGLTEEQLTIPDQTLGQVIQRYTREAGVRELERTIGRLGRKVATRFAKGDTEPVTIGPEDLSELLGPEKFFQEDCAPGVASGRGRRIGLYTGGRRSVVRRSALAARG